MKVVVDIGDYFQGSLYDPLPKGTSRITAEGSTVRAVLDDMIAQYPKMRSCLFFSEDKRIRRFVHLFLNDKELRAELELQTTVCDGDIIKIVPDQA